MPETVPRGRRSRPSANQRSPRPTILQGCAPPQAGDEAAGDPLLRISRFRELASGICPASGVAGPGDRARGIHSVDSPPAKQAEVGPASVPAGRPSSGVCPCAWRSQARGIPRAGIHSVDSCLRDRFLCETPCARARLSPSRRLAALPGVPAGCTAAQVSTSSTSPGSSRIADVTVHASEPTPPTSGPRSTPTPGGSASPTARVTPTRSRRSRSTSRWRRRSPAPTSCTATRGTRSSAGTSRSSSTASPHVVTSHSLGRSPWKAEQLAGGYRVSSFCERTAVEGADACRRLGGDAPRRPRLLPAVEPDRVQVIRNGIDTEEYRPVDDLTRSSGTASIPPCSRSSSWAG